jgi:hypothetical protein
MYKEDHDSGDSERAYINSNEKDNTDYKNSDSVFPPDDDTSLKRTFFFFSFSSAITI